MAKCKRARSGAWCGQCYSGLRGRGVFPGHFGYHRTEARKGRRCHMLKRSDSANSSGGGLSKGPDICGLAMTFPTLFEFLSLSRWPDGSLRSTGTITLIGEGALLKAAVHDRDGSRSAFVSARTLTVLFEEIEEGLVKDNLDWRDKAQESGKRR